MKEDRASQLKKQIEEIRLVVDDKTAVHLALDKCKRIVVRLDDFSDRCEICQKYFSMLDEQFMSLGEKQADYSKEVIKTHYKKVQEIINHLEEQHKLIADNYYMSIYMSLGLSVGLVMGLIFFDNLALGLPIGMLLGMAIGVGKDKEAKKQGKVI